MNKTEKQPLSEGLEQRVRNFGSTTECLLIHEIDRLRAEVARLEAAGDALAEVAAQYFDTGRGDLDGCVDAWRALRGGQEQNVS